MTTINSVNGPISSSDLGFTLMHEHVMVSASGLYDHYPDLLGADREERAIAALKKAKAEGVDTIVDATTFDLGRKPQLLAHVASASDINIIETPKKGETMATYDAITALPDNAPGPWGDDVLIRYDQRDVLLYAVGIGIRDLGFVYEGHPQFCVFPTFPIRWGGAGAPIDQKLIPSSPGPLNIDAERYLELVKPLPVGGEVKVRSRLIGVHPKGRGNGLVETESLVTNADGDICIKMVNGSFRRGVEVLGDIDSFTGAGQTYSAKIDVPERAPDVTCSATIHDNQAHIYRLSGDYNPLHIDPEAARFGGFDEPILHGLCTFGHCAQLLLAALCDNDAKRFRKIRVRFSSPVFLNDKLDLRVWNDGPGRVLFEAAVGEKTVVSHAYFEYA